MAVTPVIHDAAYAPPPPPPPTDTWVEDVADPRMA
jgi:hypothetical protein